MNILYTITSYPPSIGGAQLYLHELVKKVAGIHTSEVCCFFDDNRTDWLLGTTLGAPENEKIYDYEGVRVKRLSFTLEEKAKFFPWVMSYYLNKPRSIAKISEFIERKLDYGQHLDLIHNVRVGREPLSYASYNLARKLKVPFVFTPLHHPRWGSWFYREYQELYRKSDALIALTPYEKDIYIKLGVNPNKVFVTGTGPVIAENPDPHNFRQKYNLHGKIVLFIGQGYAYKGIKELSLAAKSIIKSREDIDFVFIGPHTEYSKRLFAKISDHRIQHLGKVDLQTKTDALAACDIFCLPSRQESFGAVFLEAWHFEKPVIGIDMPQLRCLLENDVNGFLVKPNPKDIAYGIKKMLDDINLRKRLGIEGNKLSKIYSWDSLADKTLKTYEYLLAKKH